MIRESRRKKKKKKKKKKTATTTTAISLNQPHSSTLFSPHSVPRQVPLLLSWHGQEREAEQCARLEEKERLRRRREKVKEDEELAIDRRDAF